MRAIEVKAYKFAELSESAKERAREWYREGNLDYDWWDSIYETAAAAADLLGIELRQKPVKLMNGETRHDPAIYFSGFASQGDGACFEGEYRYKPGSVKGIKAEFPRDKELHQIAENLRDVQRRNFYRLTASVRHTGRYCHAMSTTIDVENSIDRYRDVSSDDVDSVQEYLRDFMHWIYKRLETEHDFLQSDESVDEMMAANEYEFDEEGNHI